MNATAYVTAALRTKSDQLHTELVPLRDAMYALSGVELVAVAADTIKKSLFYGKPLLPDDVLDTKAFEIEQAVTTRPIPTVDSLHALLGMITEVAELSAVAYGGSQSKKADELGDLLWYIALYCHDNGLDLEKVMEGNIAKLRARFPDKFESLLAINKDEQVEMSHLESAISAS
jgi:NTP pyrophosphatase (non-canonical NTP hydrolase)